MYFYKTVVFQMITLVSSNLCHPHFLIPGNNEYYTTIPADIYLLTVNNRNTRTRCEVFPKLTIKTQKRHHWRRSCVFNVNFEHI